MSKRPRPSTFAEIVREVEQAPSEPVKDYSGVVDSSGTRWNQTDQEISPARALRLVIEGARVAWDPCGCGGYCGFDWFSAEDSRRLIAAGTPTVRHTKRHQGNISEWTSEDGHVLVVAEQSVRWGDLIDG